jgi:nanoRNase/pAp phosphatase (c-di-AMP/oligoRNAs hydrolase)
VLILPHNDPDPDAIATAVRSRHRIIGAGRLVQKMVGEMRSAGGHGTMAGGLVPILDRDPKQLIAMFKNAALLY